MTPQEHAQIIYEGMLHRQMKGWGSGERAFECAAFLVREVLDALEQSREPSEAQYQYWLDVQKELEIYKPEEVE